MNKGRKCIAGFFLSILTLQHLVPLQALALTSGPASPEFSSFTPAGTTGMVDLFTGDSKYNIPLLDIDGYPVNLSYNGSVGMDDEASWVGLGWNLNLGSVNRQLRGLPDDFRGDQYLFQDYTRPKVTVGGTVNVKGELVGMKTGKSSKKMKARPKLSGSIGVFSDSYTGIGAEVSFNAGVGIDFPSSSANHVGMGLDLGIKSSTAEGVTVSPSLSMDYHLAMTSDLGLKMGGSVGLGYNTRQGLMDLTLTQSFRTTDPNPYRASNSSSISFNTPPFTPKNLLEYKSSAKNFTVSVGGSIGVFYVGGGISGYMNKRELVSDLKSREAYGSLYASGANNKERVLEDFMKEKENPVFSELPNLPVTVHTPDIFNFSSQAGGGQFRVYQNGTGLFSYPQALDEGNSFGAGFDIGVGSGAHIDVNMYPSKQKAYRGRWKMNNTYVNTAEFRRNENNSIKNEGAFFKVVGEKAVENSQLTAHLKGTDLLALGMQRDEAKPTDAAKHLTNTAFSNLNRNKLVENVNYLTANEAARQSGKEAIKSLAAVSFGVGLCNYVSGSSASQDINRIDPVTRKAHHLSEISVTDQSGKRLVYGIPVYNNFQEEFTFAVGNKQPNAITGLVTDNAITATGGDATAASKDQYASYQRQPGYASSFLLTEILSSDYSDITGNGVSDDDLGTAIKFNYTRVHQNYGWRTPVAASANQVNFNRGQAADPMDNKGVVVYGEKEIWYPHSIETKNKLVLFELEDRMDAVGILSKQGAVDPSKRLKRIKEIRIYSKHNLSKPVKRVVFEYSYELCPGVPNFSAIGEAPELKGKLTLKKLYFTYGCSEDGKNFPYEFSYHGGAPYPFGYQQVDRWGVYNPKPLSAALNNEWYPYSNQNKTTATTDSRAWLLHTIKTPTRSTINFEYEPDDYSYVQGEKAMAMHPVEMLQKANGTSATGLSDMRKLKIHINHDDLTAKRTGESDKSYFQRMYLNGSDYLYTRFKVFMSDKPLQSSNADLYDYVSCYAKIKNVSISASGGNSIDCIVELETFSNGKVETNPLAHASWQKLRMEYPQYAYPGYDSRASPNQDPSSDFQKAITALGTAISTLGELKESFNEKAQRTNLGTVVKLAESFVKISPGANQAIKLGGGTRVKSVLISDSWNEMTAAGGTGNTSSIYGVSYDYTKEEDGQIISSGVASNEPTLGGEESALRLPVPYVQTIRGAINGFYQLEAPFGEAYFPSPVVGYSQVKVKQVYKENNQLIGAENGYSIMEFYTTREFPTLVEFTKPQVTNRKPRTNGSWFTSYSSQSLTMSQGYRIELNDMNGKEKGERVFGEGDVLINSTEYIYNSVPYGASQYKLSTEVPVIQKDGSVVNAHLGREIEVVADMYEDYYENVGTAYNVGIDLVTWWVVPHTPIKQNVTQNRLRTATLTKIVTTYGLVRKIIKMDRGSSIATENMAFDAETGQTLISKTFDEFKRPIYSVNLPAHWAYDKMGGAYKTQGVFMSDFSTNADGAIVSSSYNTFLQAGDELLGISEASGLHMWVVTPTGGTTKRLVDRKGKIVANFSGYAKIVRSSYRNMLGAGIAGYTCMENPIVGNQLMLSQNEIRQFQVLNASAQDYTENWDGLVSDFCPTCPEGTFLGNDQTYCVDAKPTENCGTTLTGVEIDHNTYSDDNARIYTVGSGGSLTYTSLTAPGDLWKTTNGTNGPMNRNVIGSNSMPVDQWYGFGRLITNSGSAREVFIGIGGDNKFWIRRNGETLFKFDGALHSNYQAWHVLPITLLQGDNYFEFLCYNTDNPSKGGIGVEIYDNSRSQITSATLLSHLNRIFKTTDFHSSGKAFTIMETETCKTCPDGYYLSEGVVAEARIGTNSSSGWMSSKEDFRKGFAALPIGCHRKEDIITNEQFNPYVKGFLGNYRPQTEYTVMAKRAVVMQTPPGPRLTQNASKSGHLDSISPVWRYNSSSGWYTLQQDVLSKNLSPSSNRRKSSFWVEANKNTLYDLHGQPIESKDVLNNYSAARMGWNGTLPELVATNTNNEDVYFDSFEDDERDKQKFLDRIGSQTEPILSICDEYFLPDFSWRKSGWAISNDPSSVHTGINAWQTGGTYTSGKFIVRSTADTKPAPYVRNSKMEYTYNMEEKKAYSNGFSFYKEKDYIFSAWVRKSSGYDVTGLTLSVTNGTTTKPASSPRRKAVVEKWILVEFTISAADLADLYSADELVEIKLQGATMIDDLRIFPSGSNIKTYVYDPLTFKVMAELDENNLATLYEYDDQGALVRIKKETDRGIITIKESRTNL